MQKIISPANAVNAPIYPVTDHPNPNVIATPPRKGPNAFAKLNAAWLKDTARVGAFADTSINRICNAGDKAIKQPRKNEAGIMLQIDCAINGKPKSMIMYPIKIYPTELN